MSSKCYAFVNQIYWSCSYSQNIYHISVIDLWSMEHLENIETWSYITLILGVTLDNFTTKLGISNFNLYESNYITKSLMDLGLWSYFDILLCATFIIFSYKAYRILLQKQNKYMFIFPLISGSIRLLVGVWNISIF